MDREEVSADLDASFDAWFLAPRTGFTCATFQQVSSIDHGIVNCQARSLISIDLRQHDTLSFREPVTFASRAD